jgi:hypothetical protein
MSQVYHSSNNLFGSIQNQLQFFTIAAPTAVDITISNPQNLPGQVQLVNAANGLLVSSGIGGRTTLAPGSYFWRILNGPTSTVLGATGHIVVVQDRIN